jgi:predicted nucleic acid-binding protein
VRFWDASAIVPLLIDEPHTALSRRLFRQDGEMVVWTLTRVEAFSALCRKRREGKIDEAAFENGKQKLAVMIRHWVEIDDLLAVRGYAERFLNEHPLRAADALQLGAAWHHAGERPKRRELVVFDGPLVDVASKVGFTVLSPDV